VNREDIKALRPIIPEITEYKDASDGEQFQTEVLRPIAKYQNVIILKMFSAYLAKFKLTLEGKSIKDQESVIVHAMKTNKELKSFYHGLMASMMTAEEFDTYSDNRSELNKRITALLTQRIVSQMVE